MDNGYNQDEIEEILKRYMGDSGASGDSPKTAAEKPVEKPIDKTTDKAFAVLTSCSAPTYFDCVYDDARNCYIDGGMWKNSPIDVLNAGLQKSGWKDYKILNLNTGLKTPPNHYLNLFFIKNT